MVCKELAVKYMGLFLAHLVKIKKYVEGAGNSLGVMGCVCLREKLAKRLGDQKQLRQFNAGLIEC